MAPRLTPGDLVRHPGKADPARYLYTIPDGSLMVCLMGEHASGVHWCWPADGTDVVASATEADFDLAITQNPEYETWLMTSGRKPTLSEATEVLTERAILRVPDAPECVAWLAEPGR